MPLTDLGGLSLWHDSVQGPDVDPAAIPVVMIQGLGMQATEWPATLIQRLAVDRRVIFFDNRDAGLSQLFGPAADPALTSDDFPGHAPLAAPPAYVLRDMAQDVLRLLDFLEIHQTHVIGFSMGGMIGQILAAEAGTRVASLVGLMTSAGQPWIESTNTADRMMRQSILFEPDHDRLIAQMLAAEDIYAGRSPLPDIDLRRIAAQQSISRAYRPAGIWRQACAMRAAGSRGGVLRSIGQPTLLLHGEDDPVIAMAQAAEALPFIARAAFKTLDATGHILTDQNADDIAGYIKNFWQGVDAITCAETNIRHPLQEDYS